MSDEVQSLADAIAAGSATSGSDILEAMRGLFGSRYHKRAAPLLESDKPPFIRNAYGRGVGESEHVAYAGFINPDNPPSGPYGGASLVWFPCEEGCRRACFVGRGRDQSRRSRARARGGHLPVRTRPRPAA